MALVASSNVATYDGNLLAFNEIFCAIKGALCWELWVPYFSAISQAYKGPSL